MIVNTFKEFFRGIQKKKEIFWFVQTQIDEKQAILLWMPIYTFNPDVVEIKLIAHKNFPWPAFFYITLNLKEKLIRYSPILESCSKQKRQKCLPGFNQFLRKQKFRKVENFLICYFCWREKFCSHYLKHLLIQNNSENCEPSEQLKQLVENYNLEDPAPYNWGWVLNAIEEAHTIKYSKLPEIKKIIKEYQLETNPYKLNW